MHTRREAKRGTRWLHACSHQCGQEVLPHVQVGAEMEKERGTGGWYTVHMTFSPGFDSDPFCFPRSCSALLMQCWHVPLLSPTLLPAVPSDSHSLSLLRVTYSLSAPTHLSHPSDTIDTTRYKAHAHSQFSSPLTGSCSSRPHSDTKFPTDC